MRYETLPGEQGQVDWGMFRYKLPNGKTRRIWAFVMVLSWSRAIYVEFVPRADIATFLRCQGTPFGVSQNSATCRPSGPSVFASRVCASTTQVKQKYRFDPLMFDQEVSLRPLPLRNLEWARLIKHKTAQRPTCSVPADARTACHLLQSPNEVNTVARKTHSALVGPRINKLPQGFNNVRHV